ncbi:MAG: 4-hydroxybenzoate octaprenyltransferase [Methylophilaceae bacterium]
MSKFIAFFRLVRLNKPIGIFLLLWPTLWGMWLASHGFPNFKILAIFIVGTILMRSAGCAVNDLVDRKVDPLVARTKYRPVASGMITPKEALLLIFILLSLSFCLVLQLNALAVQIAFLALFFVITYPFTKRFFIMPQLYLGITFGFGILMAFAAIQNQIPIEALMLFVANIFWAISYDSHYAISDMNDDKKLKIHSAPLTFGHMTVKMIFGSYCFMFIILFLIGFLSKFGLYYYIFLIISIIIALYGCRRGRNLNPNENFRAFLLNNYVGFFVFLGFFSQ